MTLRRFTFGLGILGLALAGVVLTAAASHAQQTNSCLKCSDTTMGCTVGGSRCCCNVHCEYVNGPQPGSGTLVCNCTPWCSSCGSCRVGSCSDCNTTDNNRLASETQTASNDVRVIDDLFSADPPGTFDYTDVAAKSLYEQSWLAASVLDNLTTKCAGKGRVTLRSVTNAPFEGRLTTLKNAIKTAVDYTGRLTIRDHRAILDIDRPTENKVGRIRMHAEVTEDGQAVLRETVWQGDATP